MTTLPYRRLQAASVLCAMLLLSACAAFEAETTAPPVARLPAAPAPSQAEDSDGNLPGFIVVNAINVNWQQWLDAEGSLRSPQFDPVPDNGLLPDAQADGAPPLPILDEHYLSNDKQYGAIVPYFLQGEPYRVERMTFQPRQEGNASWYGPGFNGRRTASGEIFNMHLLTAAHRTLPMPSLIRVTNLSNNLSVIVKVNDRGPFHSNRILDLSYAAARQIGMGGETRITIESIEGSTIVRRKKKGRSSVVGNPGFLVEFGHFSNPDQAHELESQLLSWLPEGLPIFVKVEKGPVQASTVTVGPMLTQLEVNALVRALQAQRLDKHIKVPSRQVLSVEARPDIAPADAPAVNVQPVEVPEVLPAVAVGVTPAPTPATEAADSSTTPAADNSPQR